MAKLIEQTLVITVSRMVPNSHAGDVLPLGPDNIAEIASVIETLAGDNSLVEIVQA
jgi:hypothetical protein